MTARERSAIEHDLRMYGALWRSGHQLLVVQRDLARQKEAALRECRLSGGMVYHSRELAVLREEMAGEVANASRAARSARDLHLELLGG